MAANVRLERKSLTVKNALAYSDTELVMPVKRFIVQPPALVSIWLRHEKILCVLPGNTNRGESLSTVDLLIKVACVGKKINNIFNVKRS